MPRIRMLKRTVANKTEVKPGDEINVSVNESNLLCGYGCAELVDESKAPTTMKTTTAADLVDPDPEVSNREPETKPRNPGRGKRAAQSKDE